MLLSLDLAGGYLLSGLRLALVFLSFFFLSGVSLLGLQDKYRVVLLFRLPSGHAG